MSYSHLSPIERGKIELLHKQGWSKSRIALELGRDRTTVGRELGRNGTKQRYCAQTAQTVYFKRRKACRPPCRLAHEPLREFVQEKIAVHGWSPELVAGRLRDEFPSDVRMRVCHETLYQAIYTNRYCLDYLVEFLTQARPSRRKRGQGKSRRGPSIPNRVSIHERPASVGTRSEHGHWEGDLVVGKGQDGFLFTAVERSSRRAVARLCLNKSAALVAHKVVEALEDYPVSWVKSITFDNGTEFAQHEAMTRELHAPVYFADPYSAYQRGSNEQLNGLIRRKLPKTMSFRNLSQQQINEIIEQLNNRPRKCLNYRTPNEVFQLQRKTHLRALSA